MTIRLVPTQGPDLGPSASWSDERPRSIGRGTSSDLVVNGRGVSGAHCEVYRKDDAYYVRDLRSTNGTFVNEEPVVGEPRQLRDGDQIALGMFILRVELSATGMFAAPATFVLREATGTRTVVRPSLEIGRRSDAPLRIEDSGVSRDQATITMGPQGFVLRDEQSRNGTYVNGERVVLHRLASGDRITLASPTSDGGRTTVLVEISGRSCTLTATRLTDATIDVAPTPARIMAEAARAAWADAQRPAAAERPAAASPDPSPAATAAAAASPAATQPSLPAPPPAGGATRPGGETRAASSMRARSSASSVLRWATRALPTLSEFLGEPPPPAGAGAAEDVSPDLSRVIRALEKQKARYRGGKWVPTSDLLPHRGRRLAALVALAAPPLLAVALVAAGRPAPLSPGPLTAAHDGDRFRTLTRPGEGACNACHTALRGTDAACARCHTTARMTAPHDGATLERADVATPSCAFCHHEHRGEQRPAALDMAAHPELRTRMPRPVPALPVDDGACRVCHGDAHEKAPLRGEGKGVEHVRVFFSSRWVHALHPQPSGCARCHAGPEDRKTGRVTTGCADCHGGKTGSVADAACATCHGFHKPRALKVQRVPDPPLPPGFSAAGG